MPAGRPVNHDAKINRLVAEPRKTLISREAARIEGAVASHLDCLVASLQVGVHLGGAPQAVTAAPAATAA